MGFHISSYVFKSAVELELFSKVWYFKYYFFYNETEYTKNNGESFNFFCSSACCDSVWLPRKCGKVEKKNFPIFPTSPPAHRVSVQFFFIKKHKLFGNLIMIWGERWSWFEGKGCVFQRGSKFVECPFSKFEIFTEKLLKVSLEETLSV